MLKFDSIVDCKCLSCGTVLEGWPDDYRGTNKSSLINESYEGLFQHLGDWGFIECVCPKCRLYYALCKSCTAERLEIKSNDFEEILHEQPDSGPFYVAKFLGYEMIGDNASIKIRLNKSNEIMHLARPTNDQMLKLGKDKDPVEFLTEFKYPNETVDYPYLMLHYLGDRDQHYMVHDVNPFATGNNGDNTTHWKCENCSYIACIHEK